MGLAINRIAFLSGDLSGRNIAIRPPWSIPEQAFRSTCNSCSNCLDSCPTKIIGFGRGRMPQVNFENGECLFCGDCVDSCESGALDKNIEPWPIRASIDSSICLAFQKIECRSCEDNCENRSIQFTAQIGGAGCPDLNTESCTGCGACYAGCPVRAITMIKITKEDQL